MTRKLVGACVFAQSGGPTAVINASAAGVFLTALNNKYITHVYAASHGVVGLIQDELFDINKEDVEELKKLKYTPSSAMGSSRYKLKDFGVDTREYEKILETFKKHNIRYLFFNGGNDSMDTCNKISKYMKSEGYECRIIGIPKTIDNDLAFTDHCPGYGSAAKYIATTIRELDLDVRVYDIPTVTIVEIMGRNAGWLTASASLAYDHKPDLIYLPEVPFSMAKFLEDVERIVKTKNTCFIAVSEGLKTREGEYVAETKQAKDNFGHTQLGGVGKYLENVIRHDFGYKCRSFEFSLMQRCAGHVASKTDIEEAYNAGKYAVQYAIKGETDKMVILVRSYDEKGEYKCKYSLEGLSSTANIEKEFPEEWINKEGTGVTEEFLEYARPLIKGEPNIPYKDSFPDYANLKKVRTE